MDDAPVVYQDILLLLAVVHLVLFNTVLYAIHPVAVRPVNLDTGLIMVNAEIVQAHILIVLCALHHVVLNVRMDTSLVMANAHHAVFTVVRDPTFLLLVQQLPMPCVAYALV